MERENSRTRKPLLTVVLARDKREFDDFCRLGGLPPYSRRIIYASDPAKVDGMRDFEVLRAPGWRDHPKAVQIDRVVTRNQARFRPT